MTLTKIAAATVLAGLVVSFALPAEAARKRPGKYIYYGQQDRQTLVRTRSGRMIVVNRRSFLDPGTETKQYDEHYTDYAFPPGYSVFIDKGDPKTSFNRMPLNDPYDMPGPKY